MTFVIHQTQDDPESLHAVTSSFSDFRILKQRKPIRQKNRPVIEDILQFIEFQGVSLQIRALFCRFKLLKSIQMKPSKNLLYLTLLCILFGMLISCKAQYGCPSNGKNVGAERILSGEKVPKAPKFKA
jgi:hypothetical protein